MKNFSPAKNQSPYGDFLLICRFCVRGVTTHGADCKHCSGLGDTKITWEEAAHQYGQKFVARLFRRAVVGAKS